SRTWNPPWSPKPDLFTCILFSPEREAQSGRVSGRGHGDAVVRDDLRLERKHVAGLRIDERLHPVDVVHAVRRVVAEGLDAREVLQPSSLRVEQRFIDAEVVRVAVDVDDRPLEVDRQLAELDDEVV